MTENKKRHPFSFAMLISKTYLSFIAIKIVANVFSHLKSFQKNYLKIDVPIETKQTTLLPYWVNVKMYLVQTESITPQ